MLPNIMLDANTLITKSEILLNEIENMMSNVKFTININNIYLNTIMDLISSNLMVDYYEDDNNYVADINDLTDIINMLAISIFFTISEDTLDNKINIIKNNIELERLKTEINLLVKIINDKTIIYKTKLTEHIKNNFNTNLYNIMSDLVNSLITI